MSVGSPPLQALWSMALTIKASLIEPGREQALSISGHQHCDDIIKEIVGWATSMGLVLKTRKCKSLSIKAGCSGVVEFSLGDYAMASIKQDPYMKFLGGFITYDGKGLPKLIYEKMKLGRENIRSCLLWDEHKVRIYKEYFVACQPFHSFDS
jgi:hypothetical protein